MASTRRAALLQKVYIATVAILGMGAIAYASIAPRESDTAAIALLAALSGLAQRMPVALFASSSVSLSVAFSFAGILLFGPAGAILVNIPSALVHAFYPKRRPFRKAIFNIGLSSVAAGASGLLYASFGQVPISDYLASALPVALTTLCYFFIQSLGVTAVLWLGDHMSFGKVWTANFRWLLLHYLGIGGISMAMALAYRSVGPLGLLSFSLPLVMVWYSLQLYMSRSNELRQQNKLLLITNNELEEMFLCTIRALATAAETNDQYTHDHSEVAMRYAGRTARQMGLDARTVVIAQLGALFHDIGKIGIGENILRKPAPLDDGEWLTMRQHPVLGARVIGNVEALRDIVPTVLYHHERFDGAGYPDGLSGSAIPLTAQIVAVVDAYQAMTSERPYRKPPTHEEAVAELRRHAGTQFNPEVVEAFVAAREAGTSGADRADQIELSLLLGRQQAGFEGKF